MIFDEIERLSYQKIKKVYYKASLKLLDPIEDSASNWPLLFSEPSQSTVASEGFRLLFLCRKSDSFTVEFRHLKK